jgi:hypothetical protein
MFAKTIIASILGAAAVAAVPQYSTSKASTTTSAAYYPAPTHAAAAAAQCQTKLRNPSMDFSFSPVPIWKEPWVVGTCKGAGNCEFAGETPFEGSPLRFHGGGHVTTAGAASQVGQSFTLCPAAYDYKLKIGSAVVGGHGGYAAGTEITLIIQIGEAFVKTEPIPLTRGEFSEYVVEVPKSKAGGAGFAFWTAKAGEGETVLVDYVDFI